MNEAIYMIEARARKLWEEREKTFPKFTRMSWESGSRPAQYLMAVKAQGQLIAEGLIVIGETGVLPGPNAHPDTGDLFAERSDAARQHKMNP